MEFIKMKTVMKKFTLAITILAITFSAWAVTLDQAKQQGLVGEMANGYLGVVKNNSDVQSLVASVNAKRKAIYLKLARQNKLTMEQVTALAGKKALAKTKAGNYIKNASGAWVKK